jgi:hypothetical protein
MARLVVVQASSPLRLIHRQRASGVRASLKLFAVPLDQPGWACAVRQPLPLAHQLRDSLAHSTPWPDPAESPVAPSGTTAMHGVQHSLRFLRSDAGGATRRHRRRRSSPDQSPDADIAAARLVSSPRFRSTSRRLDVAPQASAPSLKARRSPAEYQWRVVPAVPPPTPTSAPTTAP